jgi:threonyl-tRNA synthetase
MKGYPKHVAIKQDFLNLLEIPEFKDQALADLAEIRDLTDDTATRTLVIQEDGTAVTEEIENPMPLWKIKGFSSRQEITDLIREVL